MNLSKRFVISILIAMSPVMSTLADEAPWPGKKGSFHGFEQYDFKIGDLNCKMVVPNKGAAGKPWIIRARFFGHEPQTDVALLKAGFHVAFCDIAGLYGAPEAVARWDRFYVHLTEKKGFAKKVNLEGMSRGGLIVYNWAAKNPEKVNCIYGDAPVCDFKSWPKINPAILKAYKLTEEEARAYSKNPVDHLAPLAKHKVALIHVVGEADKIVPVTENSDVIEKRYRELGGEIKVIRKPGVGHHPHSLKDPKPIVDFILAHQK
jgi:pimeloyl-ACP methyl ester carboxylesterase